jgi:hypothetical protein
MQANRKMGEACLWKCHWKEEERYVRHPHRGRVFMSIKRVICGTVKSQGNHFSLKRAFFYSFRFEGKALSKEK